DAPTAPRRRRRVRHWHLAGSPSPDALIVCAECLRTRSGMGLAAELRARSPPQVSERSIAMTAPAPAESQRLQTLRGVACLLLVAFHAIGNHPTSGLHVADDSSFRFFANLFQYVRMPLFTFLSGFVYAYRPVLPGSA